MARPNGRGGWDLTDEDVAEVLEKSSSDVDRIERYSQLLAASEAERDRLRVIVDLACAEVTARSACIAAEGDADSDISGARRAWTDAQIAMRSAVAAEVARRAQV